jgi:hypothetical protein
VGFLSQIIPDAADDEQTTYSQRLTPMSTLKQVAKEAHVSVGTVSNVIRGTAHVSPELRERVLTAIRELEYYPGAIASDLVKQTYMLGMVLPDITNPFFPEMMRGAEDRAYERGYLLVTADTDERIEREKKIVSALRSRRVDGILLAAAPGKDTRHVRAAMEAGISVVCIDRSASGIDTDAVLLDNAGGAHVCAILFGRVTTESRSSLGRSAYKARENDSMAIGMRSKKRKLGLRTTWFRRGTTVRSLVTNWGGNLPKCATGHLRYSSATA